jgi:hypothetical protein
MEKPKEYNLRYLLATSVLHEEKRRTGSDSKATKIVSDVFRHRSRTGKSYCWTRSDVGSERFNTRMYIAYLVLFCENTASLVLLHVTWKIFKLFARLNLQGKSHKIQVTSPQTIFIAFEIGVNKLSPEKMMV